MDKWIFDGKKSANLEHEEAQVSLVKKKKHKSCRFLTSAISITHTNSFVVIATKLDEDLDNTLDEFGRAKKRIKSEQTASISAFDNKNSSDTTKCNEVQKRKKKNPTAIRTTSRLPSASMKTVTISPQDALSHIHLTTKLYKQIEVYVKPLLVLDVNGILCHRIRNNDIPRALEPILKNTAVPDRIYREPIGYTANTHVVARTDLKLFLSSLKEHFTLAIWSSAKKKTVKELARMLFPEKILRELLFIWGQEKCEKKAHEEGASSQIGDDLPDRKAAYKGIIFLKHLSKVWHEHPLWNKSNTLLLDDSPDKCQKYIENCLHPPPILGLNKVEIMMRMRVAGHNVDTTFFCDETNELKQMQFFESLGKRWEQVSDHNEEELLMSFLKENGKNHMNWRC